MTAIESREWVVDPAKVHPHVGHTIEIADYHSPLSPAFGNLAIECITCSLVLADIDYGPDDEEATLDDWRAWRDANIPGGE